MAAAQVLSMPGAFTADIAAPAPRQFMVPGMAGNDMVPMPPGLHQDGARAPYQRCAEQEALAGAAGSPASGGGGNGAKPKRGKAHRNARKIREAEEMPVQQGRTSFPCLLGRLGGAGGAGAGGAARARGGAPPAVEENLRRVATIAANKIPYPEAGAQLFQEYLQPEASRGSSADGAASRSTASSSSGPAGGRQGLPLGALLQEELQKLEAGLSLFEDYAPPEALELGIGTSPPTGGLYTSASAPLCFDHELPMKVALPSRPPPALATQSAVCVPCRAWPASTQPPQPPQPQLQPPQLQPPQPQLQPPVRSPLCTRPPPGLGLQDMPAQQSPPHAIPTIDDFMLVAKAAGGQIAPPPGLDVRMAPSREGAVSQAVHRHIATLSNANNSFANECFGTAPGLNGAMAPFGACQATASPTLNPPLRLPQSQDLPRQSAGSPMAAFSPVRGSPMEACSRRREAPSFGFDMPGRAGGASPTSPTSPVEMTSPAGESSPGNISQRERRFTCKFVFSGFDLERDADFELVPRLIGRGGANMRDIAKACDGKVRIRGRGSGHREQQKGRSGLEEADVPLQIALSCKDQECFEEGRSRLLALLEFITMHFERYCRRKGLVPTPTLFSVVTGA